jgi:hypothetical protein
VIRLLGSLGPVDHEPELLQLAMGFFESPSTTYELNSGRFG